ncbi:MAG: ribonuclease J [Candidatus Sumerlaeaceae bacterium]|nr:ribonuclease J [Candidatus Sumerlaeaceae bacterium]
MRPPIDDIFEDLSPAKPETQTKPRAPRIDRSGKLRIIPLGGLGEVGMNMMIFHYGDDMFAVDCGQMIPDDDLLGIDMVIPDISYVLEHRRQFRAIILTHAHEDHIGALPFLLRQINVPIFGSELTCEIVRERLREYNLHNEVQLNAVEPRDVIRIGKVAVEFIHVTHSIPQTLALAIRLPFGNIIFTGDFKIDATPMDNRPFDYNTFARYGDEGVLALFSDSTNISRPGFSTSEREVIEPIEKLMLKCERTIFFSCFASSLHRVQVVLNLAEKLKRKVFVTGLNMTRNIRIAESVGCLRVPPGLVYDIKEMRKTPPEKRVILTTGSQGEPLSALSRMALDEHSEVKIKSGDYVILSSRLIPGNEKAIYRMINHLFRRGADVFYQGVAKIHSSGHAQREELRLMISLCRPKYFMPIHGEFRHLVEHKALGVEMGIDPEKVFILQDGDVLEMDADGAARGGKIPLSRVLVDGRDVGGVDDVVLRDRKHLSEDGMVIVMLVIEQASGELVAGPDIVSRGFLYMDEHEDFFEECKRVVLHAFERCEPESKEDWGTVKTEVRRALKKHIKAETGRFPVILPVVLEI